MTTFDAYIGLITAGDTVDGWVDWLTDYIRQIGPGVTFIGGAGVTWWALDVAADSLHRRRIRRSIRHIEHYINRLARDGRKGGES